MSYAIATPRGSKHPEEDKEDDEYVEIYGKKVKTKDLVKK